MLARRLVDVSRSRVRSLIEDGAVRIEDQPASKASISVRPGQTIHVVITPRQPNSDITPENIPLDILYEDASLAVINKRAGMVVHPAPGHATGTLVNALLHRYKQCLSALTDTARPGIVHRLDRGTSGLIIVALTDFAHHQIADQFASRTVSKEYLALVYGRPKAQGGSINTPLGRDRSDRKKISTNTNHARNAHTDWSVEEDFPGPGVALLRAFPYTGRTHQLRVHLAHIHHPLVGDPLYAGKQWKAIQDVNIREVIASFDRPALHAHRIAFQHPQDGRRMEFEVAPPTDLSTLVTTLRKARHD